MQHPLFLRDFFVGLGFQTLPDVLPLDSDTGAVWALNPDP